MTEENNYNIIELRDKAISGIFWVFIDRVGFFIASFAIGIIQVRLLTPKVYGLFGMTGLFFLLSGIFANAGLSRALVQKKDITNIDYSTAFYTSIAISLLMNSIIFLASPLIADFFKEPSLTLIMRVLCIASVLQSFTYVQNAILTRELKFRQMSIISLTVFGLSGLSSLLVAYLGYGIWALVNFSIVMNLSNTVIMWFNTKWKPELRFSLESLKKLISFGYSITLIDILNSLFSEAYNTIIGKKFRAETLGFYTRAKQMQDTFSNTFTNTVLRVIFPILSRAQDDPEVIRAGLTKVILMTGFINFNLLIFLSFNSTPIFIILFTDKWIASAGLFSLLCFDGLLAPFHSVFSQSLLIIGKSGLFSRIELIKRIIQAIVIYFTLSSVYNLIYGIIGLSVIYTLIGAYSIRNYLDFDYKRQAKSIYPYLILSATTVLLNLGINYFIGNYGNIPRVIISFSINLCYVGLAGKIFKLTAYTDIMEIVIRYYKIILKK